ncbi:hypothetical protein HYY75_07135, partial [bacterium]|nr:hypothetical protein [bacterium]
MLFSPSKEYPRLRWAAFCLVFYGIPIFLSCWTFRQISEEKEIFLRNHIENRLEKVSSMLSGWTDTGNLMNKLLNAVSNRIFSESMSLKRSKKLLSSLEKKFPKIFEFTILDGEGNVNPDLSGGNRPQIVLKKFFQAWKAHNEGDSSLFRKNWSVFYSFLGPLAELERFRPDILREVSYSSNRTFVFCSSPQKNGMAIVHLNQISEWDSVSLSYIISKFNQKSKKIKAFLIDMERLEQLPPFFSGEAIFDQKEILDKLELSPSKFVYLGNYVWEQVLVSPTLRFIVAIKQVTDPQIQRKRLKLVLALTGLFGILSLLSWFVMIEKWRVFLSIRLKLIFLFLYTVGLPLSVMSMNARNYLTER